MERALQARRWIPWPLIAAFWCLLICAVGGLVLRPAFWPWAVATLGIYLLALPGIGLWPRSTLLGPNWTSLPSAAAHRREIALTFDDGPDPDITPKVLDILDAYGAKATFFCIGERAAQYPDICRDIVRRGHAIENHSQRHRLYFFMFGTRRIAQEIKAAQDTLAAITGQRPLFFRAPAGLRNLLLNSVLMQLGLQLASWTRRGFDTVDSNANGVLHRLARELRGGDILLLHDGNAAGTRAGRPVVLDVLPRLLESIVAAKLRTVTLRSVVS
jgi:peptidoglycan-N-acetylglucosamine deacetylase